MNNLAVSLPIRRDPGVFMNVLEREHGALNNQIFDMAKFISVVRGRVNLTVPTASHELHCLCLLVPFFN